MNTIKISKLKLAWKFFTGGREGVLDYALDIANSLADRIPAAKQEEVKAYFDMATNILNTIANLEWLCPKKWQTAYRLTQSAFADLVSALADFKIERAELDALANAFQLAYAAWRAE